MNLIYKIDRKIKNNNQYEYYINNMFHREILYFVLIGSELML